MKYVTALIVVIVTIFGLWLLGPSIMNALGGQPLQIGAQPAAKCPDTTVYGYSAGRNDLNSSLEYQAGTVAYTKSDGTTPVATDTMTAGFQLSYKSTTIPCTTETYGKGVYVFALGDAARASDKTQILKFDGGTSITANLIQEDQDQLTGTSYDTTLTNTSTPSEGTKGTPSELTAVAMSAGDSRSGYIDLWQATGSAQYGSHHDGILFCIDTVNSAAFTDKGISLSSQTAGFTLTETSCNEFPKTTSVDSCNRCYKSRAIKSTDSRVRIAWTMTNDGGTDCGASDDPVLYIEDIVYFQDTDGLIKLGTHDSSGTNVGETQCTYTWANS